MSLYRFYTGGFLGVGFVVILMVLARSLITFRSFVIIDGAYND